MRSLPSWQIPFLGVRHFPRSLTRFEIKTFFSFSEKERAAIRTRRGDELRLAFGIHLGFLKMTGTTLNALDRIPIVVLAQVSTELDLPTIDIETVRSLYKKRQRTLYDHQQWVMQLLNIDNFDVRRQRSLIRAFASSRTNNTDVRPITVDIMCWLYTRGIRIPSSRRIQELALKVTRRSENELASSVETQIPNEVRRWWEQVLFSIHTGTQTNLEWLASSPKGRSTSTIEDAIEKLLFLRLHSVPFYSLPNLSVDNLVKHAHRCRSRRASTVKSISESTRDLEIACFLRHSLLVANDTILSLCDLRTTDLRRHARDKANTFERTELHAVRELLSLTCRFAADNNHSDAEVRQYVLSNLSHHDGKSVPRAQRYREALCADGFRIRQLLRRMSTPRLECVKGSKIESLLKLWKNRQRPKQPPLSDEQIDTVPDRWRLQVTQSDTKKAIAAFDCVVLTELRCALRNGSAWAPDSLSYVQKDAMLIDIKDWKKRRKTAYRDFNLPQRANRFLQQRIEQLESGLSGVADAVEQQSLLIDDRGIHMERLRAVDEDRLLDRARTRIIADIGTVQFPQIIVDIDKEIRFSWQLLQRAPRSTQELLSVYGALLAHGTARTVSEVSLMMPGVSSTAIANAMKLFERDDVLRSANNAVVELMFRQPISKHWGTGRTVSSDGMSLDASRLLWNARVDPKRRTYGMGQYQHVLDRWGIVYNQPIVLGTRQAGAAIEGAVRQQVVTTIDRIAVDTHGYTDFAMGLARLLGYDLCPRLKSLSDRLLYVPSELQFPERIAPIVRPNLKLSNVESQWDEFVRLAASIKSGTVTATAVLKRFGSMATGDPLYRAGKTLGRLERSIFLCDLLTNPEFRRELHRDLSHGEAVHSLQRKIYQGGIGTKRGRRPEELAAISGSLTLLTNIVMAWNTLKLQHLFVQSLQGQSTHSVDHLVRIAPIHHRHINFNGHFTFPIEHVEDRLLRQSSSMAR